jgi:hypothetical protein
MSRPPRCHSLVVLALLLVAAPSPARAQNYYSSGIYAEMELGATSFLGETGGYIAPGPALGVRAGYDLFSWFSVGGIVLASTHEATVPPPPDEEYFQLYTVGADGRLTLRAGRIAVFGEGALALAAVSTNVLDKVDITGPDNRIGTVLVVGGGIDYHIQNRHFSVGLAADWALYPDFAASQSVTGRLYLRYTK